MKKITIFIILVLTLFSYTVFADNSDKVSKEIKNILSPKAE